MIDEIVAFTVRLSPKDAALVQRAAEAENYTYKSEWIRHRLVAAAKKALREAGEEA